MSDVTTNQSIVLTNEGGMMDIEELITECYNIPENDAKLAKGGTTNEWAIARKAIDEAIFKAGIEEGARLTVDDTLDVGKQLGRVEVVEWLKEENDKNSQVLDGSFIIAKMNAERWQAKLKEWNIEKT